MRRSCSAWLLLKGTRFFPQESEHGALMLPEPKQQVLRLGVLGTTSSSRPWRGFRLRIFGEAFAQDGLIFSGPGRQPRRASRPCPSFARGDGAVHPQKQVQHPLGPLLLQDLVEESEFAQQMGVAQAVHTFQIEIGAQAIVDESTGEAGKQGKVLDRLAAALAMHAVPREALGAEDVESMERACDAQTGLIGVGGWVPG